MSVEVSPGLVSQELSEKVTAPIYPLNEINKPVLSLSEQYELEDKLLEKSDFVGIAARLDELPRISVSHDKILEELFRKKEYKAVAENLEKFTNLNYTHDEILRELLEKKEYQAIVDNLEKFTKLSASDAHDKLVEILIKNGQASLVDANLEKFKLIVVTPDDIEKLKGEQIVAKSL